ncbi:MAG: exodeoxyribonuclease VII large subunit [Pedobacter sp.]|nr:exodeoxyribonuclease VII large subunit [Pedobacter sp.]
MEDHLSLSSSNSMKLSQLTGHIQHALDNVFAKQTFWVIADVTNYTYKAQSNYHYFELVEKDSGSSKIIAKIAGRAWGNASLNILNFENATGQKFRNDINVLIQVSVQYSSAFGMHLNLLDIDTNYSLGLFEQQRKQNLERLVKMNPAFIRKVGEQYITRNNLISFNRVIQKLAIISSETSAGYLDFKHTLDTNPFGYRFEIDNYFTLVQGEVNAAQILAKMVNAFNSNSKYDALIIIRGGGAQIDFLIFDNYDLSRAVAKFPIPVITGIGHQKNETIVDLMANTATKTPTKAAEFIIAHNRQFEESILSTQKMMLIKTLQFLTNQKERLSQLKNATCNSTKDLLHKYEKNIVNLSGPVLTNPRIILSNNANDLTNIVINLRSFNKSYFNNQRGQIAHFLSLAKMMSPQNILNKGFAIVKANDKILNKSNDIQEGDELTVIFSETKIKTIVQSKSAYNGREFDL